MEISWSEFGWACFLLFNNLRAIGVAFLFFFSSCIEEYRLAIWQREILRSRPMSDFLLVEFKISPVRRSYIKVCSEVSLF